MKCIICGKEIERSSYSNEVLCSSECFKIDYWNDVVKQFDSSNAVINGEHYTIGNENDSGGFRGHSGRKFKIKFFDGREIVTTNLWYQGVIPETHKDKLPDNAVFIAEAAYEKLI